MDESKMAAEIAKEVISNTQFWIAIVGFLGVIIGSIISIAGNFIFHWYTKKPEADLEKARILMLIEMLDDSRFKDKWRTLSTLSAVIGASEEETKRLLFKAKARGSEKGDEKWGLIKNHPLPNQK